MRTYPRIGLGVLAIWLCGCASMESPGRPAALSEFTGEARLSVSDVDADALLGDKNLKNAVGRPEKIHLSLNLHQDAYPDCLRIPDGTSASLNGLPMVIDEHGSNNDWKGHHCDDPRFTFELSRDLLDGSDGIIRITDGKTTIGMRLPRLLSAREVSLQTAAQTVAGGDTLTLLWTAGTQWAPESTPRKLPRRVVAFFRAPAVSGPANKRVFVDVATEGLVSTLTVPKSLPPGTYSLRVHGSPLIEAAECETVKSCIVYSTVDRIFKVELR